jgi:hypothetical protein
MISVTAGYEMEMAIISTLNTLAGSTGISAI